MKKMICWLMLLCLALAPTLSALADAEGTTGKHTIEKKRMDFFFGTNGRLRYNVYFFDGSDVPYLALSDWPAIVNSAPDADAATDVDDAGTAADATKVREAADATIGVKRTSDVEAADDAGESEATDNSEGAKLTDDAGESGASDASASADDSDGVAELVATLSDPETVKALAASMANDPEGAKAFIEALADIPEAQEAFVNALDSVSDGADDAPDPAFLMAGNVGILSRPNGYSVEFDCDADVIHFMDYDAYMRLGDNNFLIDMIDGIDPVDADGNVHYFARSLNVYERYGQEVTIKAGDYGIDFIAEDGECYVPMQTLSDILMSAWLCSLCYNGECVIIASGDDFGDYQNGLTPLGEIYYSVPTHERSKAMAEFTYNELCLVLDNLYGLKDSHSITTFRELAEDTGLDAGLKDTDPVEAEAALYQLLELHLDDQHTAYGLPSPASGYDAGADFSDKLGNGQSTIRFGMQSDPYKEARLKAYPNGIPAYEEIGNTAYITFDEFSPMPKDRDYYKDPPTAEEMNSLDAMGLMIYAYGQITREDSPIDNVVMDLSLNIGGSVRSAVYVIATYLGVCTISSRNTLSGALVTGNYIIDLNLDGTIDDADRLLMKKNLFCLETPSSFSSGNLVPCAFKASNVVTLLGRTSGGGSCKVQPLCTADGSTFQISGTSQVSFLRNGAFYDTDQGADPDFPLMKPASFYDREALTDYINSIR